MPSAIFRLFSSSIHSQMSAITLMWGGKLGQAVEKPVETVENSGISDRLPVDKLRKWLKMLPAVSLCSFRIAFSKKV